jgi:endonuclease/exonuclease/phosphatase family metal-dependent hydrolase
VTSDTICRVDLVDAGRPSPGRTLGATKIAGGVEGVLAGSGSGHRGRVSGALRVVVAASAAVLASSVPGAPVPPGVRAPVAPGAQARAIPEAPAQSAPAPVPAIAASPAPRVSGSGPTPFVLLQMNLCNSGMAVNCYSFGKAVDEAADNIRRYAPDLVTVQEVCRDDVYAGDGWGKLAKAMADLYGGERVSASFVPARNRYTGQPYTCLNGEQFGVAMVYHGGGRDERHGWYRSQDPSDEERAWTCGTVVEGKLTGCTTHLSTDRDIAMRQCRELMSTLKSKWVMPEVIVAGDLNLRLLPGDPYDVRNCASAAYLNKNDSWLQQVFFSQSIPWVEGRSEKMRWTDHPLLYQKFRL